MKRLAPFLQRTVAPFALITTLIACGGAGVNSGNQGEFQGLTVTPFQTKLTLPASRAVTTPPTFHIWTSAGEETPDASGNVNVKVFNNGPQYTEVRDDAGNMVAAGFVGSGRTKLSLETTAEALAYFAVGGPLQRGSVQSQRVVLEGIKKLSGFEAVQTAVTNTYNSQGYVSADASEIRSALDALVESILASRSPKPAATRGPKVDPTTAISGLEINNDVNDQIQIKNTAFRRSYMWLVRTGFKDDNGNKRDLTDGIAAQMIDMPGRYGGQVDSATGLITGQYSWQPITMDPHPVSSDISGVDNEEEVYYQLTTVGVGRTAGDFEDLTPEQFNKWEELVYWTAYLDFYVPVFANLVLPLDGAALDSLDEFALKHANAQAFITAARSSMPQVSSLTAQGRFPDAVAAFVGSSQTATTTTPLTAKIMLEWGRQYGSNLFRDEQDLVNRVGQGSSRIGMIDLASAIAEMAPFQDIQNADQANIFKITSGKSAVKVVADAEEIGLTDTANLEAIIKNPEAGVTYSYEWTVNNSNFFVQDVDGKSTDESPGGILKSTRAKVFIGNLSNNEGTPTVTCRVLKGTTLVGVASTRIAFKDKVKEGTGKLRIEKRITLIPGTERYNFYVACIAEVPKVPNAAHHSIVIEKANGEDVLRTNWDPTRPPRTLDTELWIKKPENVFWVGFDGVYPERGMDLELATAEVDRIVAGFEREYASIKIKVTNYFD